MFAIVLQAELSETLSIALQLLHKLGHRHKPQDLSPKAKKSEENYLALPIPLFNELKNNLLTPPNKRALPGLSPAQTSLGFFAHLTLLDQIAKPSSAPDSKMDHLFKP